MRGVVPKGAWSRESVQKAALERFGRENGVKELDDWYSVQSTTLRNRFTFIRTHHGTLQNALKNLYPQHDWDPLRFQRVPKGYWTDTNTQRDALERLGKKLGVKKLDDWYSIPAEHVYSELSFITNYYSGSMFIALKKLYPQHDWDILRFSRVPRSDFVTHKEALERIGREQLGVKKLDDWYSVSPTALYRQLCFLNRYGSLFDALKKFYPQHDWDPLRFAKIQKSDENTYRDILERFGKELGVKELDDWYSVSATAVYRELGFIKKYGSLYGALKKLYPQHNWDPFRFFRVPQRFWSDENVQRDALERVGREKYGVKKLDDWYSVPCVPRELGFLGRYESLYHALKKLYPHHNWDPLRFSNVPRNDENSQREALEKFGKKLGVNELDDWYSVCATAVHKQLGFLKKYKTLFNALQTLYPQHEWDPLRFQRIPNGYWHDTNTVKYYHNLFTKWQKLYVIRTVRGWYELPPQKVEVFKRAAKGIFGSKMKLLESWFPDIIWHSQYTSQHELQSLLMHVIADANVKNHRFTDEHSNIQENPSSIDNQWNSTFSKILLKLQ